MLSPPKASSGRVRREAPRQCSRGLRAVQLDTISVLARSHELVTFARLGPVGRARIDDEYWGPASATFEYWSHAACILPLEDWPAYGFQRRARIARGRRWHRLEEADKSCSYVRDRLRSEGPLSARELGGAKRGGPWWDWTETKIAAEWLLDIGELACRRRKGFQRVYDLAERAIPAELFGTELADEACHVRLVEAAARALGVATASDLAAYHGLTRRRWNRPLRGSCADPGKGRRLETDGLHVGEGAGRTRAPDARPCSPRLSFRLPHLVPGEDRTALRLPASPRGVRATGKAGPRVLLDAGPR